MVSMIPEYVSPIHNFNFSSFVFVFFFFFGCRDVIFGWGCKFDNEEKTSSNLVIGDLILIGIGFHSGNRSGHICIYMR